mgnify:CR=1 FL=1
MSLQITIIKTKLLLTIAVVSILLILVSCDHKNNPEKFIIEKSGIDFSKIFDQYLRTTDIPILEYKIDKQKIRYRWVNAVKDFNLKIKVDTGKETWLSPSSSWQVLDAGAGYDRKKFKVDQNFYIQLRQKH